MRHTEEVYVTSTGKEAARMPTTLPDPSASLPTPARVCPDHLWELGRRAVERARLWAEESAHEPTPRTAEILSRVLAYPDVL